MEALTPRQKTILVRVIESHIHSTNPVGSKAVAELLGLGLSPASIRNEMAILEEQGYLTHPHTSAGRVPTDKGYRFYVQEAVKEEPVNEELSNFISREMHGEIQNLESLMERASRVLSAIAEEAVLVMLPELKQLFLKEVSLVSLNGNRLLIVWCTTSGIVQNSIVEMDEPISSVEVERIRNFINEELRGVPIRVLGGAFLKKIESRRDTLRSLYEKTLRIIQKSLAPRFAPRLFIEGSRYIVNQPEFHDLQKLQNLIATLEEKSCLGSLLEQYALRGSGQVAIGEKELSKEIWDCSLVSAPYFWRGECVGALGVLGPRRMPYGRILGLVHVMSDEVGQALERWGVW